MKKIAILATGGTIVSSGNDPTQMTGYKIEELRVQDLIDAVPGLDALANLHVRQVANIDSSSMTFAIQEQLARRIDRLAQQDDIDGFVITHGTDTMEETAYFLHLVLKTTKPVVLTGAMRPATALSADGPLNLFNAVRVAIHDKASQRGVMIVLNDTIHGAREVTKTQTTNAATFMSRDAGAMGMIAGDRIQFFSTPAFLHTRRSIFSVDELPHKLPRVAIVVSHTDDDGYLIDAARRAGYKGIIHAGTGNGSIHQEAEKALIRASEAGMIVVRASRVGGGLTVNGLAQWQERGWIPAGSLLPWKARILLQLALTRTDSPAAIREIFEKY